MNREEFLELIRESLMRDPYIYYRHAEDFIERFKRELAERDRQEQIRKEIKGTNIE